MGPEKHLASGIALGASCYAINGKAGPALTAMASAVLCDLDHLLEYGWHCVKYRKKTRLEEFLSGNYFEEKGKICVIFHAYEYLIGLAILFAVAVKQKRDSRYYIGAGMVGYGLHLLLDTVGNDCTARGYFIVYRWKRSWKLWEICKGKDRK